MSTPRKNFNNSYPSQAADYRTQQFGGQKNPQSQNFGFYEDKKGHQKSQQNTPHFYQNISPQETQRHRPYGQARNFGRGGNFNRRYQSNWEQNQRNYNNREYNPSRSSSGQYFHPSMLEDPWRELMDHHEAIHGLSCSETPPEEVEAS
ncbi:uncharacterized protein LOC108105990 [Drosophila eugracilis]|uniref:uncharacterized protein LOC108105990 n=1 Tax=Drosophila eugracilis TaxID=29029 RepID=UPI0007E6B67B|nr:uncharacterized protein LOC108105990 [Drosophila eugracilis]